MRLLTFPVLFTYLVLVAAAPFPPNDGINTLATRNSNDGKEISTEPEMNPEPSGQPKIKSRVPKYEEDDENAKLTELEEKMQALQLQMKKLTQVSWRSYNFEIDC